MTSHINKNTTRITIVLYINPRTIVLFITGQLFKQDWTSGVITTQWTEANRIVKFVSLRFKEATC